MVPLVVLQPGHGRDGGRVASAADAHFWDEGVALFGACLAGQNAADAAVVALKTGEIREEGNMRRGALVE